MAERESWASTPATRASMQANRGRDTGPELALRRALHAEGLRFYVNRRPERTLRRTADIVFPRARVAIFVDGCFWHGCPEHHTVAKTNEAFWAHKVEANRARDLETNQLLGDRGWTVLRIWEHVPAEEGVAAIKRALRNRPGGGDRSAEAATEPGRTTASSPRTAPRSTARRQKYPR